MRMRPRRGHLFWGITLLLLGAFRLVANGWPWLFVGWGAWNLIAAFWLGDDGRPPSTPT